MSGSHRSPQRPTTLAGYDLAVLRRVRYTLAAVNLAVGTSFVLAVPGAAPSIALLQAIAPLPAWGAGYAAVGVLILARQHVPAHLIAVPVWLFWGAGAVIGLVAGSTRSPAVTIALTGLILAIAALHVNGLVWRRREAQVRRAT